MKRFFWTLLVLVSTVACSSPDRIWRDFKTQSEVEAFVRTALPAGSRAEDAARFFEGFRLPHSDLSGGVLYASAPAGKSGFGILFERRWLMVLRFDASGAMTNLQIRAGLTGP